MFRPRPLAEQVIVITGASSGIGLATARCAAERGARVVLAARNAANLKRVTDAINDRGGRATWISADVAHPEQVDGIAAAAHEAFGGFDTWVNNAAVSIYGRLTDIDTDDMRRQFDVNYWGTVYGALTALRTLRQRGGVLINVASAVADRAIPLQGSYSAAKHAVKGFTDALRMELEQEGVPVCVSLVKPSSMDTPLFQKARTDLEFEPQPIPPVYDPEVAARAILKCAEKPKREIMVGGQGQLMSLAQRFSPRGTDRYMEKKTFDSQISDQPTSDDRDDNLYWPVNDDGGERGRNWSGRTKRSSIYTWAMLNPGKAAAFAALAGISAAAALSRKT